MKPLGSAATMSRIALGGIQDVGLAFTHLVDAVAMLCVGHRLELRLGRLLGFQFGKLARDFLSHSFFDVVGHRIHPNRCLILLT